MRVCCTRRCTQTYAKHTHANAHHADNPNKPVLIDSPHTRTLTHTQMSARARRRRTETPQPSEHQYTIRSNQKKHTHTQLTHDTHTHKHTWDRRCYSRTNEKHTKRMRNAIETRLGVVVAIRVRISSCVMPVQGVPDQVVTALPVPDLWRCKVPNGLGHHFSCRLV